MSIYTLISLFAFAMSAVCGFIMIPQILSFCKKRKLYDRPDARKIHKNVVPRLGGVSFMPSMLIATVVALLAWIYTSKGNKIGVSPWSIFFGVGITVIYITGVLDDIFGVRAKKKLLMQIIVASLLPMSYLYINNLYIPFLYHNIWGKQEKNQKIFMGDSGSLTLGYILGVLLIKFCMYNPHVMPYQKGATLLSVTLLLVPTFDVFRVIIVRILHRKPLFRADKNHIHHKLMRAGMTQHQALISIIALSLIFIIINLSLFNQLLVTWIIAIDIIIYIAFQYTLDIFIRRKGGLPFTE